MRCHAAASLSDAVCECHIEHVKRFRDCDSLLCAADLHPQRVVRQSQGACAPSVRRARLRNDVAALLSVTLRALLQSLDRCRRRRPSRCRSRRLHRESIHHTATTYIQWMT